MTSVSSLRLALAVASLASLAACAHPHVETELGPLATDRPDFTETAVTIPQGHTQVEAGVTFIKEGGVDGTSVGEILVRTGLSRRFELRVTAANYAIARTSVASAEGLEDAGLGLKIALHEGPEGPSIEPTLAAVVGTSLPTGAESFRSRRALPEASLLGAWTVSQRVSFGSNLNWARTEAANNEWSGSASFAFSLSDKVGVYTEAFGFAEKVGDWQTRTYLNAGLTYLFNDAFQVDARVGTRLGGDTNGSFFGFGLARRF